MTKASTVHFWRKNNSICAVFSCSLPKLSENERNLHVQEAEENAHHVGLDSIRIYFDDTVNTEKRNVIEPKSSITEYYRQKALVSH